MASGMDQDPDSLLDIVLRMDPDGIDNASGSSMAPPPFQGTAEGLEGHQLGDLPVSYTDLCNMDTAFDDIETMTAPQLGDLSGLMDIDNLPQVPFSPDAACLPGQGANATGQGWPTIIYSSPTHQSQPWSAVSLSQMQPTSFIQQDSQTSESSPNTHHETMPAFQIVRVKRQHVSTGHPRPEIGAQHQRLTAQPPPATKPKTRRRVTTPPQRKAANVRERRRMFNLNEAFDTLRKTVPTFAYEKRLSRIETLRLAMLYITFMGDVLNGKQPSVDGELKKLLASNNFAGLTNFKSGPVR